MLFASPGRPASRAALVVCFALVASAQPEEFARKSQDAKQLMAAGRFSEAIPIYQNLCQALPSNTGLRLNLALAYHMAGRPREAVPEFERVLKVDPANQPALLSLGAALLELNQPAKAVAPLMKFLALDPDHVEARGMLANALLSVGRPKEAAVHFRRLTALTPQDPKAWYGLGRSYEALAQDAFRELDKTAQGSAEWLALIADTRVEQRQYRSAFYFYKEALAKKPDLPGLHSALARVYRATNHPDWAAAEEQKAGKPDCAKHKAACDFAARRFLEAASGASLYWRARAYNELALEAFERLGAVPESVEMHALKAELLTNHGNKIEAVEEWRAAQRLAPGDARIERQLATALYVAGDYTNALPLLRKFLQQEPRSAELHFLIGDSLLHLEQPHEAIPELEIAARLNPKLLPAQAALGLALMRDDKPRNAIPHLAAAAGIDDDGSLHYQLARAYQASGEMELAKATMEKYQEIQQRAEAEKRDIEQKAQITPP
ncbi:MAG TPA: tetratricopeptide repeat protein [Bryobacteraceae bacterium]|jgi:predicted Zn-dependent protease|nr:tetratricopeptide repeat protein [Bryobacteraceae bacterium]